MLFLSLAICCSSFGEDGSTSGSQEPCSPEKPFGCQQRPRQMPSMSSSRSSYSSTRVDRMVHSSPQFPPPAQLASSLLDRERGPLRSSLKSPTIGCGHLCRKSVHWETTCFGDVSAEEKVASVQKMRQERREALSTQEWHRGKQPLCHQIQVRRPRQSPCRKAKSRTGSLSPCSPTFSPRRPREILYPHLEKPRRAASAFDVYRCKDQLLPPPTAHVQSGPSRRQKRTHRQPSSPPPLSPSRAFADRWERVSAMAKSESVRIEGERSGQILLEDAATVTASKVPKRPVPISTHCSDSVPRERSPLHCQYRAPLQAFSLEKGAAARGMRIATPLSPLDPSGRERRQRRPREGGCQRSRASPSPALLPTYTYF